MKMRVSPRRTERLRASTVRPSLAYMNPRGIVCSSISARRLSGLSSSPSASTTDQYAVNPTSTANSSANRP
jgi:hypothetical protein